MAANTDVIINIRTEGAATAAAEIGRVVAAAEGLHTPQSTPSTGFGGQLDSGRRQSAEDTRELAEDTRELAEATREETRSIFAAAPAREHEIQMAEDLVTVRRNLVAATQSARASETAFAAARQLADGDLGGAASTVAGNPAALAAVKKFAAETGLVLGTVTAAYVTMTSVFGGVKWQFSQLAAAYPDFEQKNRALGASLEALASPFATACSLIKDAWGATTAFIGENFDQIVLSGSLASVKNAVAARKMAEDMAAAYTAQAAAYKAMHARMEADDAVYLQKYMAMEDRLDAVRLASADRLAGAKDAAAAAADARAGLSQGTQSVNGVGRIIEADHRAEEQANRALDVTNQNLAQAINARANAAQQDAQRLDAVVIAAQGAQGQAVIHLQETIAAAGIKEQEAVSAASDQVAGDTQVALTGLAATAKADLQAKADAAGSELSSNAKAALAGLVKIMADGVIKPDEITTLKQAMDQMHASREGANSAVLAGLRAQMATDQQLSQRLADLERQRAGDLWRAR